MYKILIQSALMHAGASKDLTTTVVEFSSVAEAEAAIARVTDNRERYMAYGTVEQYAYKLF